MSDSLKKAREFSAYSTLRRRFSDLPSQPEIGEKPDLIFELEGKWIGVEVTTLSTDHDGGMARDRIAKAICRRCTELWREATSEPLACIIAFCPGDLKRLHRDTTAGQIAVLAAKLFRVAAPGSSASICSEDLYETGSPLRDTLQTMTVLRLGSSADFTLSDARYEPSLTQSIVTSAVKDKNAKAPGYRAVDELWLLLDTDSRNLAEIFDVHKNALPTFESPFFERCFFVDQASGRCVELARSVF